MSSPRPQVAFVELQIRQYRVPFFEALRSELASRDVDLRLLHSTPGPGQDTRGDFVELPWGEYLRRRDIGPRGRSLTWQVAPPALWRADLVVVTQATRLLLNYRLLGRRRRGGPLIAFWGHGRSPYPDAIPLSESVKRWASRQPDWWFAYTDGVVDVVAGFGFPRDRITSVQNSTDTRRMAAQVAAVSADVIALRRELGITTEGPVGLFVGALVPEKRLDYLLTAADRIRAQVPDFELVVVGEGPLAGWLAEQAGSRPWLHHLGKRFGDGLAPVLAAASVLLVPQWVGLVITDALAAGRPLIASAAAAHGPEIAYLRSGRNGLLVDDAGDPGRYAAAVVEVLTDPDGLQRLQAACVADAAAFGLEAMATRFADGVERALAVGRRRS
jgi:glycosyltransferase involved in cell wall biosynthesis